MSRLTSDDTTVIGKLREMLLKHYGRLERDVVTDKFQTEISSEADLLVEGLSLTDLRKLLLDMKSKIDNNNS